MSKQPVSKHLDHVRTYDSEADEQVVEKIVKHLGIALQNRDSASVATSDPSELNRVKDGYCKKKLGLDDQAATDAVNAVAETMKAEHGKDRVAFYYLVAKHAGKLDVFS